MNTCKNIIKKRMQDIGETQESLAEKLSVSQGSIVHWLSGSGGRKPDTDIIASMLNAVGIRELIINADGSASENNMQNKLNKNNFQIEGLDIKASVGAAYLNSDVKEVIKLIEYDSEQAKDLFNGVNTENLKVINISGDSIQGTF